MGPFHGGTHVTSSIGITLTSPEASSDAKANRPDTLMLCALGIVEDEDGGDPQIFIRPLRRATPEEGVAAWINVQTPNHLLGSAFITAIVNEHLTIDHLRSIYQVLRDLELHHREIAIQLIVAGAFSRRELVEPSRIASYLARPDWAELLATWKADSFTRQLRHVAKRLNKPAPPPPPGRWKMPSPSPINKRPVPHRAIRDQLPRRLARHAANIATALDVLASQPTATFSAETLTVAVRQQRSSAGVNCPVHVVREALTHLGQRGLITIDGNGFRHQPRPEQ